MSGQVAILHRAGYASVEDFARALAQAEAAFAVYGPVEVVWDDGGRVATVRPA